MADFVNTVLTMYKADTSDAKAAVKSLRGEEAKAARERLQELDAQNKGIDSQIAMWGKATLAIGAVVGAYKVAQVAAKAALEDMRLESAAAGANIEALKLATRGLVEEDALLAFAGKTMSGVWKLNQKEMETVLNGAMALRKTMGVELQPTVEALTEAITKGSTRALKEFGIEAKDKTEALRQLQAAYERTGGAVGMAGDEFEQADVKFRDAMDNLMGQLGKLAIELAPVVSLVAELIESWSTFYLKMLPNLREEALGRSESLGGQLGVIASQYKASVALGKEQLTAEDIENIVAVQRSMMALSRALAPAKKARATKVTAREVEDVFTIDAAGEDFDLMGIVERNFTGSGDWEKPQLRKFEELEGKQPEKAGMIERIFGNPERIAEISVAAEMAAGVMDTLSNSAGAAMDAWITGQKSISGAISDVAKEGIKSLASTMSVKALYYGLEALGYLLTGNVAKAGAAGKLSGLYAAGALAAGVAAKGLYSAGSGTGAASSSGAGGFISTGGGGAVGAGGDRSVTIVLDDAWYGRSKAERAADMARAISQARRGTSHIRRR